MQGTQIVEVVLASRYGPDCRDRVQPLLADWYASAASAVWDVMTTLTGADCEPPRIEVVHSPQSLPQLIAVGQHPYLIYDQHLGQVFARLTRLTAVRASPAAVDAYLCKLTSVRLLARGRSGAASVLSVASRHFNGQAETHASEAAEGQRDRHALTQGQEAFVLGHELAHHLKFRAAAPFASFEEDVDMLLRQWQERRRAAPVDPGQIASEMARSAIGGWERRHGPLGTEQAEQLRALFAADVSPAGVARDAQDTFDAFTHDAELREEATCDVLASMATIPALVRGGASAVEAVEACGYAMHHLRLVQSLNAVADGARPDEIARGVATSAARLTILRACLGSFLEAVFGAQFISAADCHDAVTRLNLLHAEVIGDQLWLMTSRTLRELLALPPDDATPLAEVRAGLGFAAPVPVPP